MLCGVPETTGIQVQALKNTDSSGAIDMLPARVPVRRLDLVLAAVVRGVATLGTVSGVITTDAGVAVSGARVTIAGTVETRTGKDGKFIVRDIPNGTRQLEVLAIGM